MLTLITVIWMANFELNLDFREAMDFVVFAGFILIMTLVVTYDLFAVAGMFSLKNHLRKKEDINASL